MFSRGIKGLLKVLLALTVSFGGILGCLTWEPVGPEEPVDIRLEFFVGCEIEETEPLDVAVEGDYVYMLLANSVIMVNVSDKRDPTVIGEWVGGSETGTVAVEGHYLYLADSCRSLAIIDVSDPESPERAGQLSVEAEISDLFVLNSKVYLAISEHFASGPHNNLHIIDVSQPTEPELLGTSDFMRGSARRIWVAGPHVYVTNSKRRVEIFDVSNPTAIGHISSYSPEVGEVYYDVHDVSASDYRLCLPEGHGVEIVDVSDPRSPETMVGRRYCLPEAALSVFSQGHYAYVGGHSQIYAFNTSDATNACVVDECDLDEMCRAISIEGDWIYCACGEQTSWLKIVKIVRD